MSTTAAAMSGRDSSGDVEEGVRRWKAEVIDGKVHSKVGESPVWSASRQTLFYVDIEGKTLHRLNMSEGRAAEDTTYAVTPPARLGTIVLCSQPAKEPATFVCGAEHSVVVVELQEASKQARIVRVLAELPPSSWSPEKPIRFNDGKADPSKKRIIIGTMSDVRPRATGVGAVYCFARQGEEWKLERIEEMGGMTVSNGLCWSMDGKRMYHIDTPTGRVTEFEYNCSSGGGGVGVGRRVRDDVVVKPANLGGVLDGMVMDSEGQLWIAHHRGGIVTRWAVSSGEGGAGAATARLTGVVEVPTKMVTSVCFGGPNMTTLLMTSSTSESDDAGNAVMGRVFKAEVGIKGLPLFEFDLTTH